MQSLITGLLLAVLSISLAACSNFRGNVVPQRGPSMEQIYDSLSPQAVATPPVASAPTSELTPVRQAVPPATPPARTPRAAAAGAVPTNAVQREFHQLPNPELQLYIYPHLAGQAQVPVPGYYTAVTVYDHDYYALPNE